MSNSIPILWPDTFKVDVQTPFAILQVQAESLGQMTKGILKGAVETETTEGKTQHRLVVIAPAYKGYRHTLLSVLHDTAMPYPAEVRAAALANQIKRDNPLTPMFPSYDTVYPKASSDEKMQELVAKALRSNQIEGVILSLIAKSNEARSSSHSAPSETPNPNLDDSAPTGDNPLREEPK